MIGRPTSFSEEMNDAAVAYIDGGYESHGHPLPSAVGMAVVLGVAKSTLYAWAERPETGFSDTLGKCNDCQELKLLSGGLTNLFNSTITKLALANHGYSDKVDSTLSGPKGGPVGVADMSGWSEEDLDAYIAKHSK